MTSLIAAVEKLVTDYLDDNVADVSFNEILSFAELSDNQVAGNSIVTTRGRRKRLDRMDTLVTGVLQITLLGKMQPPYAAARLLFLDTVEIVCDAVANLQATGIVGTYGDRSIVVPLLFDPSPLEMSIASVANDKFIECSAVGSITFEYNYTKPELFH